MNDLKTRFAQIKFQFKKNRSYNKIINPYNNIELSLDTDDLDMIVDSLLSNNNNFKFI